VLGGPVSSSIRPPGGSTPGTGSVGPAAGETRTRGPEQVDASQAVGQAGAAGAAQAGSTQGQVAANAAAVESPTSRWIRRLEAGEVSRAEAIEGLVAQAVEQRGGSKLSPALRSELEGVLRSALLGDPVLGRLLGDS
jgi:hypothetical protein